MNARTSLTFLATLSAAQIACGACDSTRSMTTTTGVVVSPTAAKVSTPGPRANGTVWNAKSSLGSNLAAPNDWSTSFPFVDQFKSARPWISGSAEAWSDDRPVRVNDDGWVASLAPGQVARTVLLTTPTAMAGRYTVLYDGDGSIEFGPHAARVVSHDLNKRRAELDVVPNPEGSGISFKITRTNPKDPVRNFRVLPPGGTCEGDSHAYCDSKRPCKEGAKCVPFEATYKAQSFHPQFLERLKRYSVLRFMNWMLDPSECPTMGQWGMRPVENDAMWTVCGVPIEVIAKLSKELGVDPWITIPIEADDAYVARAAKLFREKLDSRASVWVELSNEVWNSVYKQHEIAKVRGESLGLGEGYEASQRYYVTRAAEVTNIFAKEFGDRQRVVRVFGAHIANEWWAEKMLTADAAKSFDVIATAPYFSIDSDMAALSSIQSMNLDDLFAYLSKPEIQKVMKFVASFSALAHRLGLRHVAYEGGQHLVGDWQTNNDPKLNALFDAANRDPRMRAVYATYLASWKTNGGDLFVHFLDAAGQSNWGRWGALESIWQPREDSPKYDALMKFVESNPKWW